MEKLITVFLLIILSISYLNYRHERRKSAYFIQDPEVKDVCSGKMVALGVLIFLVVTLMYSKELMAALDARFSH